MANWWEAAPVVQPAQQQRNWWDDAPVVGPEMPNLPPPGAQRFEGGVPVGGSGFGQAPSPGSGSVAAGQPQLPGTDPVTVADNVVRGMADVFSLGAADEIAAAAAASTGIGGITGDYSGNLASQRAQDANGGTARTIGQLAGGVGAGLGLAGAGLSLGANAINAGRPLWQVAGLSGVEGALLGGAHGFGSGESLEGRSTSAREGATIGGLLGGAAPLAIAGIGAGVRRAVTPFATNSERTSLAQNLRNEGVELTAGQMTGSRGLRFAESEIGGGRAADLIDRQGEQFTAAALRRTGTEASRATPEVIDQAFTRIGNDFDGLAARNTLVPDNQMLGDVSTVSQDYLQRVPESQRAPLVADLVDDIRSLSRSSISGDAYQAVRSRIDRQARTAASDPQLSDALYGLRTALDDAMERSIATANPADAGAWREARRQYRNMLVIEKAATGAGENAAAGLISPGQLRNATVVGQGRRNYARGQGDFAGLARAGAAVMSPLPDSGTAGRMNARNVGTSLTSLIGAGAGGQMGGGAGAVAGLLAGAAVPRVAGALMMSGPGQRYLANQALPEAMSERTRAIINALLVSSGSSATGRLAAP